MLGDLARERYVSTLKVLNQPLHPRLCIDLRGIPIIFGETDNMQVNPHMRYTLMLYKIKYVPSYKIKYKDKPMLLESDLYLTNKVVRFNDYKDLIEMSKEDEVVAFLLKWSNLSQELIDLAKLYVQIPIPFYIDPLKYDAEMKKQLGDTEALVFKSKIIAELDEERIKEVWKEKHSLNSTSRRREIKEAKRQCQVLRNG